MTDKIFDEDTSVDSPVTDELTLLKERAAIMGVKYHPSIGLDALKEKINTALAEKEEELSAEELLANETPGQKRARLIAEATRLVRIRVTCMDPNKKGWPGEIFTVSNGVIGTIRKFVPFNAENGYHVPAIILKQMKRKKRQEFRAVKTRNGMTVKRGYLVPAFAIEELPPLTAKELKDLAHQQALNHSVDA